MNGESSFVCDADASQNLADYTDSDAFYLQQSNAKFVESMHWINWACSCTIFDLDGAHYNGPLHINVQLVSKSGRQLTKVVALLDPDSEFSYASERLCDNQNLRVLRPRPRPTNADPSQTISGTTNFNFYILKLRLSEGVYFIAGFALPLHTCRMSDAAIDTRRSTPIQLAVDISPELII